MRHKDRKTQRKERDTHTGRQAAKSSNPTNELTTTQLWTDREMGKWTYTQMDKYIDGRT